MDLDTPRKWDEAERKCQEDESVVPPLPNQDEEKLDEGNLHYTDQPQPKTIAPTAQSFSGAAGKGKPVTDSVKKQDVSPPPKPTPGSTERAKDSSTSMLKEPLLSQEVTKNGNKSKGCLRKLCEYLSGEKSQSR